MTDITLPGVNSLSPPGVYTNLLFGQGQTGLPTQSYAVILLGNLTSGLSFTPGNYFGPDTLVGCQSVNDAISLFGAGSPLALMFAAFKNINQSTPLYCAPVVAASGTQASQTITITAAGSPSQTSGVIQYSVDAKNPSQAVFAAGDSASTIAISLAAAINSNTNLPVTASPSTDTVIVTAKVDGARGNNLLGFGQVVAGSGVTVSITTPTRFSSGAGSDATGYTNTLNGLALTGQRFYYYVSEAGMDQIDGYTNGIILELQAAIDLLAEPISGLRQRVLCGSNDTVAHTVAATTQINDPRVECVQCNQLDLMPSELAASWAAAVTLTETEPLGAQGVNFDGFGGDAVSQPLWRVRAPLNGSAPSASDIQTAIISGISPLRVAPGGTTNVVKRCTSRFFTEVGDVQVLDLRITDAGIVTVCDRFFDDLSVLIGERFPRMMIDLDPPQGKPTPPGVVTVDKVESVCVEVINDYAAAGLIDGASTLAGLVVQPNVSNPSSIGVVVPLFNNALAHQFLIQGLQVGPIVI